MNIDLKKEAIASPERVCDLSSNQSIDLEINLPDYCSDIKRILRCFVIPGISSVQVTGDRASAKGDVTIRLIYVGEGEKIDCYEQNVDLSCYADIKNIPEHPVVTARSKTQFVNCRAASQRRFIVGASVSVNFSVYSCVQKHICQKGENELIETKQEKINAVSKCALAEKMFDLSETIALDDNKKPVGRIVGCESTPKIESVKTVGGKILIKGELESKIVYCADTKEGKLEKITHSMPISQIVEIPGIDDTFTTQIDIDVCSVAINAKSDSSGSNRLIELAAKLSALITGTKESEICFITDCYCTKYESKASYIGCDFKKSVGNLNSKKSVSTMIDVSDSGLKDILDVRVISVSHSETAGSLKLEGKGSALLGIIYSDSKDKIQYVERNADFNYECDMKEKCEKVSCEPEVSIENINCSTSGSKVSVNFEASISGVIYSVITKKLLEEVTADEEHEKPQSDAAVTVYYSSKGEDLWTIAKKYNTSEKAIANENLLDDEILREDKILIIPCL